MDRAALHSELIRDEGLKLKPYKDTVGKLTIGVGRNLDDVGISATEAMTLLDTDIDAATAALDKNLPWWRTLGEVRQRVLVNMTFNMGINKLMAKNPKMLAATQRGDYATAAAEMLDGPWKDEVGERASRLSQMMKTG